MSIFLWILWNIIWFCVGYFTWRSWKIRKETDQLINAMIQDPIIKRKLVTEIKESE